MRHFKLTISSFTKKKILIGFLFLFSGASLLLFIYLRINLGIILMLLFLLAIILFKITIKILPSIKQKKLNTIIKDGFAFGFVATLVYDTFRYLIVVIFNLNFNPFMSFYHFGNAIIGNEQNGNISLAIGIMYHILNGITFSIAFFMFFTGRHFIFGILWALILEAFIFSIYPGWLNLKSVMQEFTIVSVSGHIAYGLTIGLLNFRNIHIENLLRNEHVSTR